MELNPAESQNPDVKALLEENLRLARAIYTSTEKTRRYIFWGQVFGFVRVLLIIIPLVLAYWYLQPYLQQLTGTYQQIMKDPNKFNVQDLFK